MKSKRYYLFSSELHDEVRLDFTPETINRFLELWQAGYSHEAISKRLQVLPIELALIAMDLDYIGRLPERKGGFWGKDEDEE